jgi:uncharacterized protein (DUF2062 family)
MSRRGYWLGRLRRFSRAYAEMHYQLRTEGDTPLRQAASIWVGTAVGVVPVFGIHLGLCLLLARLLRLNTIKTCLAAYINNPVTALPLLYLSAGIGRWMFTGAWISLSLAELREIGVLGLGRDILVGSLLLGTALGGVLAVLTYLVSVRWRHSRVEVRMREIISRRYVEAGVVAWETVRSRLRRDPMWLAILRSGILPERGTLIDLGCGRGVLLSVVRTAIELGASGEWPGRWPAPPQQLTLRGVEGRRRPAAVARTALGDVARIELRTLRTYSPPRCTVATVLDVLRELSPDDQEALLARTAEALEPGGLLLIRDADAGRGFRFLVRRVGTRIRSLPRGGWRRRHHFRRADEWAELLVRLGLTARVAPAWAGSYYGDLIVEARRPELNGP